MKWKHCLFIVALIIAATVILFFVFPAFSSTVPMPDTNTVPDVVIELAAPTNPIIAGFKLYFGPQNGVYTNAVDCGTHTLIGLTGFQQGFAFYFAGTTYTLAGAESQLSTSVAWTNYLYAVTNRILYFFTNGIPFVSLTNVVGDHFFVLSNSLLVSLNSPTQKWIGSDEKTLVRLTAYEKIFYKRTP